ncbi:hypothetical protein GCM10010495_39110 [Kitasatospora herbaricolor]|nr:hypothetical protein GCM10010495_39110 [Kitasatospora herbaricolor]
MVRREIRWARRSPGRFNADVENSLWDRISAEGKAEVDRLVAAGHYVQAIKWMRDCAETPTPGIHECVDLLNERILAARPSDSGETR